MRYKETDQMGMVYYGNYFTFFEIGRVEYMRERGIAYKEMEQRGRQLTSWWPKRTAATCARRATTTCCASARA